MSSFYSILPETPKLAPQVDERGSALAAPGEHCNGGISPGAQVAGQEVFRQSVECPDSVVLQYAEW